MKCIGCESLRLIAWVVEASEWFEIRVISQNNTRIYGARNGTSQFKSLSTAEEWACSKLILEIGGLDSGSSRDPSLFIPGIHLDFYTRILKDSPGVKSHCILGVNDLMGILNRRRGRSKYGAKRPKSKWMEDAFERCFLSVSWEIPNSSLH